MSVFRLLEHLQLRSRLNQDSPELWCLCMMVRKVAMGCLDTIILPRPRWVQLTAFLVVLRVSECVICLPLALLSFILFRFIWVFYYLSVQVYLVSCKKKNCCLVDFLYFVPLEMVHSPHVEFCFYDNYLRCFANIFALHCKWSTICCCIWGIIGECIWTFCTFT